MKRIFAIFFCLFALNAKGQLLKTTPQFITESSSAVSIIADASGGNKGLFNYTGEVYVHIGVITNLSTSSADWKYVATSWGVADNKIKCTKIADNKWAFQFPADIRTFFGISNVSEKIQKIAILFRDATGSKVLRNADGSDMYVTVYEDKLQVRIDSPISYPYFNRQLESIKKNIGDTVFINVQASKNASISILYNDSLLSNNTATTSLSAFKVIRATGIQSIVVHAVENNETAKDSVGFLVTGDIILEDLPNGIVDGVNYEAGDTSAYLVLYAPQKKMVTVIGDFNQWIPSLPYVMKMTKDSTRFWIRLTGLTPGMEYAYQYLIDGDLKVADYNAEKVLDPYHDPYISTSTYPNLKAYPVGKTTGIVSVLQTAKQAYQWKVNNFSRPNKKNLIIYEVLLRDFLQKQNFTSLRDTLPYFKKLGINTIELMPVTEFEGNDSWGYNPNFYFALDKFYGTQNAFKEFVDSAHANGIAVVVDMVMNHIFGSSPMVQMYWDSKNNTPAANNPWLNATATHPFNVGYDLNHETAATKQLVARVMKYWLTEYRVDGFRWDLSKGFTQKNNPNDVTAWGAYDASRVATWKAIYDTMQKLSNNSYCILEHFADNAEDKELSDYGMLLWGNANYNFNQATMGYSAESSFNYASSNGRGWGQQHLVTYMESHDEERLMYKNINYGNVNGTYNIKDITTGLKRNEMAAAFWALMPGPKMMWQFGELGYDFSINTCSDLSVNNNCRLSMKPVKWDYLENASRRGLRDAYAQFLKLRNNPKYLNDFISNKYTLSTTGFVKSMQLNGDSIKLVVVGNFDLTAQTTTINFPSDGIWYSVFTNKYQPVLNGAATITLQAGEYFVFANKNISTQMITDILDIGLPTLSMPLKCYPNPMKETAFLEYQLPESGQVSMRIYDMSGKDCGQVFSGYQFKGLQRISIQKTGKTQTPGIYFISIIINQKQKLHKILITN